jgi:hypothetical protein
MQYLQNEKERERVTFFQAMRADIFINIMKSFLIFDFFVGFIKVPHFTILQFLKHFLSIQVFLVSLK